MKRKRSQAPSSSEKFVKAVGRALRRSAKVARLVARRHGTSIYVMRKGKIVAVKP